MTNEMTEEMKAARRAYDRAYYASHKEEAAERKRRYWLRKAEKMAAEKAAEGTGKNEANDEHELLKEQRKQKPGHWILYCPVGLTLYVCSTCRFKAKEMSKFCPNCGTRTYESL